MGGVFASVGGHGIVALDRSTGATQWVHPIEWRYGNNGIFSSPAVADGIVYGTSSGRELVALTPTDGSVNWRTDLGFQTVASPVIAGDRLYIGTNNVGFDSDSKPEMLGIDRTDGTVIWRWEVPFSVTTTASVGDGALFVSTNTRMYALA